MENLAYILSILLSTAAIAATAYHALLVMQQRLSYFHSVRFLLLGAYALFGAVVASESILGSVFDTSTAALMLKMEISAVIIAAILVTISVTVLRIQARGHNAPYRELLRSKPRTLLLTIATNIVVLVWLWAGFDVGFNMGEKAILGVATLMPYYQSYELLLLSLVFGSFVWHQSRLLSKEILEAHPPALSREIKQTGMLWIAMSTTLFTVNGALRTFGVDLVIFGHLVDAILMGYLAYIYAKPTALVEFFASGSPLASELKRKQFSKVFDFDIGTGKKILLETDSVSDYTELAYYFLGSGWKPGVCVTYEGSPLLLAGPKENSVKIVELSMSAERVVVSKDGRIEAPLFKKNTYDLLKWTIECNPEGRLVLDGVTHLIQLLGIDEVYSIVSYVSELCAKNGVQLLLILNYQAHKLEVLSTFEGIADHVIQLERNRAKQVKPFPQVTAILPMNHKSKLE